MICSAMKMMDLDPVTGFNVYIVFQNFSVV